MPNINNELSLLIDPNKNDLLGVLGITENTIESETRPGFVWVRLLDNLSEAILAYNRKVTPVFDLPVVLSFDGIKYEVQGIDANRYSNWVSGSAYLPKHGNQHSAMYGASGNDIVWVDQQQFLPLLSTPGGSVTGTNQVFVAPYVFKNSKGQWIYAGNTGVTIPPSTMATGSTMYLLYMRDSDGVLYTKAGTPFAAQITGTAGFMPYLPGGLNNNNDIPVLAIRRNGINSGSPIGWENVLDVRQFYKGYVPSATGTIGYLETIDVYRSGVLVGNVQGIDFYGNHNITKVGNNAKVVDRNLEFVAVDFTLSGSGTPGSPLHINSSSIFTGVAVNNPIFGNGVSGNPLGIITGSFLSRIYTDATLSGSGTIGSPLSVVGGPGGGSIGVAPSNSTLPTGTNITTLYFPSGTFGITGSNAYINPVLGIDPVDISSQITGSGQTHFTYTPAASKILVGINGLIQKPSDITVDTNNVGFTLAFSPNVGDNLIVFRIIDGGAVLGTTSTDGWNSDANTWSYSSADSPSFVISVNADMTGIIGVGYRIKLTQTTAKYFIVTAVGSYSGGATLITVYGGTDYTLANAAITSPHWSNVDVPLGFNKDPNKWAVIVTDNAARTQTSPTANTWYNVGTITISIPIGVWNVYYQVSGRNTHTSAGDRGYYVTLSTANNSESDADFSSSVENTSVLAVMGNAYRSKTLVIAAKTSYYLNIKTPFSGTTNLGYRGDTAKTIVAAVCAYL